jgi:hypothetical protein
VTKSVLTHVAAPVLLVGPQVGDDLVLRRPTLVVCVDETRAADAALPVVAAWAGTFGGRAWVAHVTSDRTTRGHRAAVSRVRQYADLLGESGLEASARVLHGADPVRSLENFARTVEDAVLVASSTRWTDWEPHLHSTTRRLVQTSTRPVLAVAAGRDLSTAEKPNVLAHARTRGRLPAREPRHQIGRRNDQTAATGEGARRPDAAPHLPLHRRQ